MGRVAIHGIAALYGLSVSRPYGDSSPYDVVVEWLGRIRRVQVKLTMYRRRGNEYSLNVMGAGRLPYDPETVDFIAVYLIPEDTWYIIPLKDIEGHSTLYFTPGGKKQKYGKYKEAWELLKKYFQGFRVSGFQSRVEHLKPGFNLETLKP